MEINWQIVAPILASSLVALNAVLAVVIAKWPGAPKWLRVIQGLLADIVPDVTAARTRSALRYQQPIIGQKVNPVTPNLVLIPLVILMGSFIACACVQEAKVVSACALQTSPLDPIVIGLLDHKDARPGLNALASTVGSQEVECRVSALVHGMEHGNPMGIKPTSQVQVLLSGRAYLAGK